MSIIWCGFLCRDVHPVCRVILDICLEELPSLPNRCLIQHYMLCRKDRDTLVCTVCTGRGLIMAVKASYLQDSVSAGKRKTHHACEDQQRWVAFHARNGRHNLPDPLVHLSCPHFPWSLFLTCDCFFHGQKC